MRPYMNVLSEEEILLIHNESIRILEEIGIRFPSPEALALLKSGGAEVDEDRQVAYISKAMVDHALKTAPKQFVLGARNPAYDLTLPSAFTALNLDGMGVNTIDFHTGKRRSSVLQDIADAAKVFETIDKGYVLWPPVAASDVPTGARSIAGTGISFLNCRKHIQDEVKDKREVPYVMEMVKAILGDSSSLLDRKLYSATYCTLAPLCHDQEMMEATMELSRFFAPILIYPMPACGTTGPASLHSNIAVANAEGLSALVLFQLTTPGVPLIYGAALGIVNGRSGMFLEGAPETMLQMVAMCQMGKHYGLPTTSAGCLTDAKAPGMQAVLEKAMTSLPLVLQGTDVLQGIGLVESSMSLSLEQMIIDTEIAAFCDRIKEGARIDEDSMLMEDIKTVGHGGHYLKQPTTRRAFRNGGFYVPELCDRNSYGEWEELGRPDLIDNARKKVSSVLAEDVRDPLPYTTQIIIEEIMKEATRKLNE